MVRTKTSGIVQSDILIRSAIIAMFDEVRSDPFLLDFCFSWLANDDLTKKSYGDREIQEAKDWFANTEITVTTAYREDRPQLPCIAIELIDSSEDQATLGDVHYDPIEDVDMTEVVIRPNAILGPFTPKSYDNTTGTVTLPDALSTAHVFVGQLIYDAVANRGYTIIEIVDGSSFSIAAGTSANFTKAYVAPADNFFVATLESLRFRESYRIRCVVSGNPVHLFFLHSILVFCLRRGNQKYLEGRGFDASTIQSQGVSPYKGEGNPEIIFQRDTIINGFIRQYWPKNISPKIAGILVMDERGGPGIKILDGGQSPDVLSQQVVEQGWGMEFDQFTPVKK